MIEPERRPVTVGTDEDHRWHCFVVDRLVERDGSSAVTESPVVLVEPVQPDDERVLDVGAGLVVVVRGQKHGVGVLPSTERLALELGALHHQV